MPRTPDKPADHILSDEYNQTHEMPYVSLTTSFLFFISIEFMNSVENLFHGIYYMTTNEQKYNLFYLFSTKWRCAMSHVKFTYPSALRTSQLNQKTRNSHVLRKLRKYIRILKNTRFSENNGWIFEEIILILWKKIGNNNVYE